MSLVTFNQSTGVAVPSTREIRADIEAMVLERIPGISTDSATPMGQIIDIITAEVEAKNAEIAFLANQYNPAIAQGVFLDGLAALYGLERKTSEPTIVQCTCTGLRGTVIPYGAIVQDGNGNQLRQNRVGGVAIGDDGTVSTFFATVEHGAIEIGPETVTQIVTVIAGWDAVTNEAAGITGRVVESDSELYTRMIQSYAINANGSVANIQSNLQALEGVLDCTVLENTSNQPVQQFGVTLEPHSIGVAIVGGEDTEIAEVIFNRKPGGTATTGDTQVTFVDTGHLNAPYTYNIIRPDPVTFDVQVNFFGSALSDATQQAIKAAIQDDFNGLLTNPRVGLATDVYASRFYACIQAVTDAPIRQIQLGIDDGPLGNSVTVRADQVPTISDESITFTFGS